jgi:hypothetical protein
MESRSLARPWRVLGIRLVVFPSDTGEEPPNVWKDALNGVPDTDESQPKQLTRVQTGPWRGGSLQITITPATIFLVASPGLSQEGGPDLEAWPAAEVIREFRELTHPWISSAPLQPKRIGFGLNSLLAADDRRAAYQQLQELIPSVAIDPEETSDLFYQINRPVSSRVSNELLLNRLMKWSAPMFRTLRVQVTAPGNAQTTTAPGRTFAGLDNDVNTSAERTTPLDQGSLGAIYDELIDLALENLEFGELGRRP